MRHGMPRVFLSPTWTVREMLDAHKVVSGALNVTVRRWKNVYAPLLSHTLAAFSCFGHPLARRIECP